MKGVVYSYQLLGAAYTQKLVELLFGPLPKSLNDFRHFERNFSSKNIKKLSEKQSFFSYALMLVETQTLCNSLRGYRPN